MLESPTPDRKATVLLLIAIAGCVDAVGLAETGRYFVSFMSGNTTAMGQLLAYRDFASALLPLGLIALFVGGATVGTLVVEKTGRFASAALLWLGAALIAAAWAGLGSARPMLGIVPLPVAMGLVNIVTLRNGSARPGVTFATGSLVKVGIGLAGLGRDTDGRALAFDVAIWLCLFAGSVAGAALRLRYGSDVLLGVAAALGLIGLVHVVIEARPRRA